MPRPAALLSPALMCLIGAVASAAMLATAHGFERFGGYAPCLLCLRQREVYWAVLTLGALGFAASRRAPAAGWVAAFLLAALFATGALVAAFHAGVEWRWWPGPLSCSGPRGGAIGADAMADLLAGARVRPPSCDEAAWRLMGLSMAGWNALISLGLAALAAAAVSRREARP